MPAIPAMVLDTKSRKILVTDIWNASENRLKMPQPVYLVTSSCILTVMTAIRIVRQAQLKPTPEDVAAQPPTNVGIKPVIILMRLVAPMSAQATQNHRLQVALMAQPVVMTVALAKLGINVMMLQEILVRGLAVRQLGLVLMGVHLIPAQPAVVQVFVHHVNQTRVQEKPVLRAAVQKPVPLMTFVVIAQAAEKKQSVIAAGATKMTAVIGPVRMDISVPQMTVTPIRAAAHHILRIMIQAAAA